MDKKITSHVAVEKIIKAFANKNRLNIIEFLDKNPEASVDVISERLNIEYKVVSFHLSKLAVAGIVAKKYVGTNVLNILTSRGKTILKFVRTLE